MKTGKCSQFFSNLEIFHANRTCLRRLTGGCLKVKMFININSKFDEIKILNIQFCRNFYFVRITSDKGNRLIRASLRPECRISSSSECAITCSSSRLNCAVPFKSKDITPPGKDPKSLPPRAAIAWLKELIDARDPFPNEICTECLPPPEKGSK